MAIIMGGKEFRTLSDAMYIPEHGRVVGAYLGTGEKVYPSGACVQEAAAAVNTTVDERLMHIAPHYPTADPEVLQQLHGLVSVKVTHASTGRTASSTLSLWNPVEIEVGLDLSWPLPYELEITPARITPYWVQKTEHVTWDFYSRAYDLFNTPHRYTWRTGDPAVDLADVEKAYPVYSEQQAMLVETGWKRLEEWERWYEGVYALTAEDGTTLVVCPSRGTSDAANKRNAGLIEVYVPCSSGDMYTELYSPGDSYNEQPYGWVEQSACCRGLYSIGYRIATITLSGDAENFATFKFMEF